MESAIKPALERLDQALERLEGAIEKRVADAAAENTGPIDEALKEEKELNQLIASKLDNTIERLETLLKEE